MAEPVIAIYGGSQQTQRGVINPVTLSTAGNVTLTVAQVFNAYMTRDVNGAARSDTTPTAAVLIGAFGGGAVSDYSFDFYVYNTGAYDLTIVGGTGVTVTGGAIVGAGLHSIFKGVVISPGGLAAQALTLYRVI